MTPEGLQVITCPTCEGTGMQGHRRCDRCWGERKLTLWYGEIAPEAAITSTIGRRVQDTSGEAIVASLEGPLDTSKWAYPEDSRNVYGIHTKYANGNGGHGYHLIWHRGQWIVRGTGEPLRFLDSQQLSLF